MKFLTLIIFALSFQVSYTQIGKIDVYSDSSSLVQLEFYNDTIAIFHIQRNEGDLPVFGVYDFIDSVFSFRERDDLELNFSLFSKTKNIHKDSLEVNFYFYDVNSPTSKIWSSKLNYLLNERI